MSRSLETLFSCDAFFPSLCYYISIGLMSTWSDKTFKYPTTMGNNMWFSSSYLIQAILVLKNLSVKWRYLENHTTFKLIKEVKAHSIIFFLWIEKYSRGDFFKIINSNVNHVKIWNDIRTQILPPPPTVFRFLSTHIEHFSFPFPKYTQIILLYLLIW